MIKKRTKTLMAASSEEPICSDCGQENCSSLLLLLSLKSIADKSVGVISICSPFSPRRRRESLHRLPDTAQRLVHNTFLTKCRRAADGQPDGASVRATQRGGQIVLKAFQTFWKEKKCICTVVFFFIRAFRCRFSRCHQAAGGLQREFRLNDLLFCASGHFKGRRRCASAPVWFSQKNVHLQFGKILKIANRRGPIFNLLFFFFVTAH